MTTGAGATPRPSGQRGTAATATPQTTPNITSPPSEVSQISEVNPTPSSVPRNSPTTGEKQSDSLPGSFETENDSQTVPIKAGAGLLALLTSFGAAITALFWLRTLRMIP